MPAGDVPRRDLYLGDDQVVFLFVAHELKKKGIEPLVDSVAALGPDLHPTVRVVVVGGWPYSRLTRRIQQLGVERQFIFTGPQAVPEMFYAASDVFVLPTYYDACSLVVAEAMNCGLPVITTTANGAAGMLRPGRDGYLILHPPDPSALKTAMQRLLCPQRRREMSRMAAAAGRRYSVNANHRQMLDLFSTLADGRLPVGPGRERP